MKMEAYINANAIVIRIEGIRKEVRILCTLSDRVDESNGVLSICANTLEGSFFISKESIEHIIGVKEREIKILEEEFERL